MKKLTVISALLALLAAGCASHENRGGSYDQTAPSYGTGTSDMGTMDNTTTGKSQGENGSKGGASDLQNNKGTDGSGAATSPGGSNSGTGEQGTEDSNGSKQPGPDSNPTPPDNTPSTPDSGSSGSGQ